MTELHRYDPKTWLETVYEALSKIHPDAMTEESWDDVMSAMSWITEDFNFEIDTDPDSPTNGRLVRR
jgi:hypothetical protein